MSVRLSIPQWTLVNAMHWWGITGGIGSRRTAIDWANQIPHLGLEDMLGLERLGLVEGRYVGRMFRRPNPGEPEAGARVPLPTEGDPPTTIELALTNKGFTWIDEDPHSKVLWAAAGHSIPVELGKALRQGLDLEAVADCVNETVVAVVWMANDQEVTGGQVTAKFLRDLLDEVAESLKAVGLTATPKGRTVYGRRSS